MAKTCYELFGIECGSGWKSLYEPIIALCKKENVDILQIKEKFGTLRFYVANISPFLDDEIRKAEIASQNICEICGSSGKLRNSNGWLKVRCNDCLEKKL